jgi:hypothetical protein
MYLYCTKVYYITVSTKTTANPLIQGWSFALTEETVGEVFDLLVKVGCRSELKVRFEDQYA